MTQPPQEPDSHSHIEQDNSGSIDGEIRALQAATIDKIKTIAAGSTSLILAVERRRQNRSPAQRIDFA